MSELDDNELTQPAEISAKENLLELNRPYLGELDKLLKQPIEKESSDLLRQQISETFSFFARVGNMWAKSEKSYRQFQLKASCECPKILKSESRRMWLDGYCSNYRYQRDILLHYLDGIKGKLSAQKSILGSLNQERRDAGLDELGFN